MTIKGYKGFDKDFKCQGFQYEVGKSYEHQGEIIYCPSRKDLNEGKGGFHFCEFPLDVFNYYPPSRSRYAKVEGDGEVVGKNNDIKLACEKIYIGPEATINDLVNDAIDIILGKVEQKDIEKSNTGYQSVATNAGYQSVATNTGSWSVAMVEGKESIALAMGYKGKAKGSLGCWLVLTEWDVNFHIITDVRCVKVDGKKIKPDTFYILENGEFKEDGLNALG
ncbi:MAG: hypothetical protein M0P69_20015 [Bacteroidales bacterium]|nr:hypothetical protein [Bacteroidales bacterium]